MSNWVRTYIMDTPRRSQKGDTTMERHDKLADLYTKMQNELRQFYNKGNKAAGTRARLIAVEMKAVLNEIRTDILTIRKAEKTKGE